MAVKQVWVLTYECNRYDQEGEYFLAVFGQKPNYEQLALALKDASDVPSSVMAAIVFLERLLKGGGRLGTEDTWYNLKEVPLL